MNMVVYKSLTANVAPECLDALGGSDTEQLVTLQLRLEKDYPNVIVTSISIDEVDVIQIKGGWSDIKGIHVLLEKAITASPKTQNKVFVKTEPKTGLTDEEENEGQDETNKESSDEEVPRNVKPLKQIKFPTRRKVTNPRKSIKVEEEVYESSDDEEESIKEDIIGELYHAPADLGDGETKETNYDTDTEFAPSEENDDETEKDEDWVWKNVDKPRVTVKLRKRRYKTDPKNLIDPENVDDVVKQCIEKAKVDETNLKRDIHCFLCDYKSSQSRLLRVHILRCHAVHKKSCPICNASFGLNKDLTTHMKNHAPKIPCAKCRCKFVRQSALDKHMEHCHSNSTKKDDSPNEAKKEEKPAFFKCEECNYITEVRRYLRHHVLRNHSERQHKCEVCNKLFGLEKDLRQHMKNHTDANCVQCEECGKTLRSKFALHLHINSIHRGIKNMYKKEYVCDHCGKVCANKTVYNDHINKDHLNVKRFGCPLCPMTFFTKYNLRHHLVTHSTEKNYSCETCGKDFKRRSSLRIHQRIHEAVRMYTCQTCNKSFHQQGALKRHERIHTGEKPYKCSICQAAFTDYSILRRHLMGIHKQDKSVSRQHLRKNKLVEGINRGGEKKDTVTVNDISKYRGVFRGVEEYVHFPELGKELDEASSKEQQPEETSPVERFPEHHTLGEQNSHSNIDSNSASIDQTSMEYRSVTESISTMVTPRTSHVQPEQSPISVPHIATNSRHNVPSSVGTEENHREVHPPQFNFSSLPLSSLPEVLNPMCLSSMQYSHSQRPDFYATAGALLQAAQQQQQQQQQQHKSYDGHPLPEGYYYQNHPL